MTKMIFTIAGLIFCFALFGQGLIKGTITDENGEPLIGASVYFKSQPTVGVVADIQGRYSIQVPANTTLTLVYTYISYQPYEEEIIVKDKQVLVLDIAMVPESKSIDGVVITAKAKRSADNYMQLVKMKSSLSLDYISAETIKKTGDSYASDAIKRVTGVSLIGGFVSVRGLADRYIKTAINGMRIPTLDPLTNNIKLDIFPTSLMDNIVITKTSGPNLPSDWAGSYISIETKDYPEKLMFNFSTTFGYNTQSSFREVASSNRSSTDWLGFDDGYRSVYRTGYQGNYPQFLSPSSSSSTPLTPYLEFAALGLTEYMNEMGFTEKNLDTDSKINRTTYYKLCLVELGLLSPGLMDNHEAVESAVSQYNNQYQHDAFITVNTPVGEFSKTFPNNWGTIKRKAPIGYSQEISLGNQMKIFGRPLGYFLSLRYASSVKYDPNALANSAQSPEAEGEEYITVGGQLESTVESVGWSSLIGLSYAISPNHSVSLLFMPNFTGVNYVRQGNGKRFTATDPDTVFYKISQYYEERKQLIYQFHSSHYFPTPKLKVALKASYTDGSSSIPDSKTITLYPIGSNWEYHGYDYNYKRTSYLFEDVFDAQLNAEFPLSDKAGLIRKVSLGSAYQMNTRENEIYEFTLSGYPSESGFIINDLSQINNVINVENFNVTNESFLYYNYNYIPTNFVMGESSILAGFMMIDYSLSSSLRLSGGLRLEYTDMLTDVQLFHELNLPDNDPQRKISTQGLVQLPSAKPGRLKRYDYLPSLNLVYQIKSNDFLTINARFGYGKTIARPSIREITPLYQEDFIIQKNILGNPNLKPVEIDNYDLRFESYFKGGENISITLFYKKFLNHIELVEIPYVTWQNASEAEAVGLEIEGQVNIFKNLDIKANLTLVESFSKINIGASEISHSMYGQAPYIINAILGYESDKTGLSASLSYNVQGPKLAIVTLRSTYKENADIFEMPQHLLDLKIAKSAGEHFVLSFKARNMLNAPLRRSYDFKDVDIDYDKYYYGTEFSLGVSYNL